MPCSGVLRRHDEAAHQTRQHIQKLQGFTQEMPKAIREILLPCIGKIPLTKCLRGDLWVHALVRLSLTTRPKGIREV